MEFKTCQECNRTIRGRADKKFCSSGCRNAYHNRKNGYTTRMVRNVNQVLRRNRNILLQCGPIGISKKQLAARGFDFNYFTNTSSREDGKKYYFCYDQGYVMEDEDRYKIIPNHEL